MTPYEKRVKELENIGMTTSDAQGAADVEFAKTYALTLLLSLESAVKWVGKYVADGNHNSHIAQKHLENMEKTLKLAKGEIKY